ncbi:MAG: 4-hydroxy-3-methylbut-2-enyl diphosphate reductase, partial [Erysipelotrichaceae bacterium]|nr:4-hydroxy-3-methylbut-2-enyl diphosphate reductase [Erysipelotrichaceae bacterium]
GFEYVIITCQTNLSLNDTKDILRSCKEISPDAVVAEEICAATRMRQEAVMNLKDTDCLIVVGDPRSNNSNQLKRIAFDAGIREAYLIGSVLDLKEEMVKNKNRIAVTSGSSTPNSLTEQVLNFLRQYAETGIFCLPEEADVRLL